MVSKIEETCIRCLHYFKVYRDLAFGECHLQSGKRHSCHDDDSCTIDSFEDRKQAMDKGAADAKD